LERILIIANRKTTVDSLLEFIEGRNWCCDVASNRRAALRLARTAAPDAIILDNTSARLAGPQLAEALRRVLDVPLIAIVREEQDAVDLQATRCLTKPYSGRQLMECVQEVLEDYPRELTVGPLSLNLRTRCLLAPHQPEPQQLTPKLFALLRLLMKRKGTVVSRELLMAEVWNTDFLDDTRTLDVHIHWIRQNIEPDPDGPCYLQTIRGEGYRLECPEEWEDDWLSTPEEEWR
jgi:DNA-binding response OmpR family regulator